VPHRKQPSRLRLAIGRTLIDAEKDNLSEADMAEYRRHFLNAGEDRRPMLTWPRQIPLDGSPPEVAKIKSQFCDWLRGSAVPKLWVRGRSGFHHQRESDGFLRKSYEPDRGASEGGALPPGIQRTRDRTGRGRLRSPAPSLSVEPGARSKPAHSVSDCVQVWMASNAGVETETR
jgi:hypothetical protein